MSCQETDQHHRQQGLALTRQYLSVTVLVILGLSAYGCKDSVSVSDTVQVPLSSLTITPPGTLQPGFSSNTTSYTAQVPTAVTGVTVAATPKDNTTTMTINGTAVGAGHGQPISLDSPGTTIPITIVLSSQTGTESTYTVTVTRLLSSNNNLSALSVTPGTLSPAFDPNQLTYTMDVAFDITSVLVSATKSDPAAVISGDVPNSGQRTIPLDGPGTSKVVSVIVTAPNGGSRTYRITINRLVPSSNDNLAALTVSDGSLNPAFAAGMLNYAVEVANIINSITVTATKSDPAAVMAAAGSVIAAAGTPTGSRTVDLGVGTTTTIAIIVTAQDGINAKIYSINVFRQPPR